MRIRRLAIVSALALLIAAACAPDPSPSYSPVSSPDSSTEVPPSEAPSIFAKATPSPTASACPQALLTGFLVAQGDELIVVQDPVSDGSMPIERLIWQPWEFEVGLSDGELAVRDPAGVIRARQGDHVHLGGGEITAPSVFTVCGGDGALSVDAAEPELPFGRTSIDAAQAVQLSREHVSADMSTLSRVQVGGFSNLETNGEDDVWAVTFTGLMTICPSLASTCELPRPGQVTVYLDYSTGNFRESHGFSPG